MVFKVCTLPVCSCAIEMGIFWCNYSAAVPLAVVLWLVKYCLTNILLRVHLDAVASRNLKVKIFDNI